MSRSDRAESSTEKDSRFDCPRWCVTHHDLVRGEDDWVHESAPLHLEDGVGARLCMSLDPSSGEMDGPYVLVGSRELTVDQAESLGVSFLDLAATAAASIRRGAGGTRSPGP
jgi:hypothetical protein